MADYDALTSRGLCSPAYTGQRLANLRHTTTLRLRGTSADGFAGNLRYNVAHTGKSVLSDPVHGSSAWPRPWPTVRQSGLGHRRLVTGRQRGLGIDSHGIDRIAALGAGRTLPTARTQRRLTEQSQAAAESLLYESLLLATGDGGIRLHNVRIFQTASCTVPACLEIRPLSH